MSAENGPFNKIELLFLISFIQGIIISFSSNPISPFSPECGLRPVITILGWFNVTCVNKWFVYLLKNKGIRA